MTLALLLILGCGDPDETEDTEETVDTEETDVVEPDCAEGEKTGPAEGSDDEQTSDRTRFTVRVPAGYDPTVAHPLVVVYAPAGGNPELTEQFTDLTPDLTGAGYLVAYADHESPSTQEVFENLGEIPGLVAEQWCVDEARVHFTGHSDGGSVASVLAVYPEFSSIPPASIAPSAAGVNGAWLEQNTCPDTLPVMVLHSRNDSLFPGFGAEAVAWWAECNGCAATPGSPDSDGCVTYPDCDGDVQVIYCEGSGSHGSWPRINDAMITFFDAVVPAE